jgi:hypothetical protein
MEIMDSIRAAIKELILPDLDRIREESREIKAILAVTNKRIDAVREKLTGRIDETNNHINETNKRIDETNRSLGHLYEVIVRREEHFLLTERVVNLEREVASIKEKLAA